MNGVLCLLSSALRDKGEFRIFFLFPTLLKGKNVDSQLTASASVEEAELNYLIAPGGSVFRNRAMSLSLWLVRVLMKLKSLNVEIVTLSLLPLN